MLVAVLMDVRSCSMGKSFLVDDVLYIGFFSGKEIGKIFFYCFFLEGVGWIGGDIDVVGNVVSAGGYIYKGDLAG